MKYVCVAVLLLLGSCFVQAQDGCYPAQCMVGYHSVCHKECDPNGGPACIPVCKCHCEKDQSISNGNSNFQEQTIQMMKRASVDRPWAYGAADKTHQVSCLPDKESPR